VLAGLFVCGVLDARTPFCGMSSTLFLQSLSGYPEDQNSGWRRVRSVHGAAMEVFQIVRPDGKRHDFVRGP
jgi:hypothetical protein